MTGIQDDLATLAHLCGNRRHPALARVEDEIARLEQENEALGRGRTGWPDAEAAEDEIARLKAKSERQATNIEALYRQRRAAEAEIARLTRDGDPDYSPEYQDEYRRLWHGAAKRAEAAEAEVARLLAEKDKWHEDAEMRNQRAEAAEAEVARLRESRLNLLKQITDVGKERDAADSEVARLKDGLRDIADPENDASELRRMARALLADGDAAADERAIENAWLEGGAS